MSTPLYRQTTGHIHLCLHLYTDRRLVIYSSRCLRQALCLHLYTGRQLVIYSSRCIKKSYISTPLYRQMTGHIQQQMYKDKVYVYTVIQADDWSYKFMSTSLYRQATGHIQQQMYKDKVYVYTFIQADDWAYTIVDV